MSSEKPEFATNRPGERVADALNGHLAHLRSTLRDSPELAVATAYFNVGGFALLADELEALAHVRILLGAEPAATTRAVRKLSESASPARAGNARLRIALTGHARSIEEDRDLLGFDHATDATARRLVAWLESGRVEVRRLEDAFLHGKAFVVTTHDEGVIAGSSNFTYAGLATNLELNLGHYQPHVVGQVSAWFADLWDRAAPFDLASIFAERYEPHSPYLVYLRMLLERYGTELSAEAEATTGGRIHLTSFQRDGVWRAKRILAERNGVVVADEVGLGKTFLAGELIRQVVEEQRQRVLVVAPATLRDGPWAHFLREHQLGVERLSFEQLVNDRQLNPDGGTSSELGFAANDYAMVVVDEAHYLRNPSTQRASALRRLLGGSPPKALVLVTATPVSNSLWDLFTLLGYFLKNDAAFADVGISSLRDHFADAMAMNPDDLSPEHLFDVLDAVAVRRTRSFVRDFYADDTVEIDGRQVPIRFPDPRVIRVNYALDSFFSGFFDRFARALEVPSAAGITDDPTLLNLARYTPSRYRLDDEADAHQVQHSGLLRSGLLKRFESSAHAFALTCERMAASHDHFLALIDGGWVATGEALADWVASDSDELDASFLAEHNEHLNSASEFDVEALVADVERDRELLRSFATDARSVTPDGDPKLAALVEELAIIAASAESHGRTADERRDLRKVIVFSYFSDTVEWIDAHLREVIERDSRLATYRGRVVTVSGSSGNKREALFGFAPRTTQAPPDSNADRFDIMIATDVVAEGVNLQQAAHIINFDLPWNPMRLVQRHGRIDRIGSQHDEVFIRCVFPDANLDELLGLEERLQRKLKQAAASVGVGGEVLPGSRIEEVVFSETREEIQRLAGEDATIFVEGGSTRGGISGEEYRQELKRALEDDALAARLRDLAWGSGSGFVVPGAERGFVFCTRVADHDRVLFRWVPVAGDDGAITKDTLSCLATARPPHGDSHERVLSDSDYARAFDAWMRARDHIVKTWNFSSDPANLAPRIPATARRAAMLLREHAPAALTHDVDRLVEAIEAPYRERELRELRWAMASSVDPAEQALAVAAVVDDLGLEPSPLPEPLPEIDENDVHLVCWLAILPE